VSVRFLPAGDLALAVEFDDVIGDALAGRLRALEAQIAAQQVPGVTETVPSFRSLLVYYDPQQITCDALCTALSACIAAADASPAAPGRTIEIPCCYRDPALGFDLAAVAARLGLDVDALIARHAAAEYLVYFIGFAPGQPYLTGLPPELAIPRLESPRTRTPAGAVGIGGTQCCIYSVESPGGFWVLGHTPLPLYDPQAESPLLLRPGDRLRFRPIERGEHDAITAALAAGSYRPVIA
jgi:KipI family sensor histidine kinase inhibitor